MSLLLIILLIVLLAGSVNFSSNWGYAPSGIIGLVLVVVVVLALLGRL
jgi:hypothetical protein